MLSPILNDEKKEGRLNYLLPFNGVQMETDHIGKIGIDERADIHIFREMDCQSSPAISL